MKKYFIIGTSVTFIIIFNLGYVFHERLMGNFFREEIGNIQRENYIIPVIAVAFIIYIIIQAYLLHIFIHFQKTIMAGALQRQRLFLAH